MLLVGAGGLGAPAALYLAAAGVGTIGVVDSDRVEVSNLQRQVLYDTAVVGRGQGHPARNAAPALNPNLGSSAMQTSAWTSDNALEPSRVRRGRDGTDNFPTRYLVNDACVPDFAKPDVFGSVYRFEGQVSVFDAPHGQA